MSHRVLSVVGGCVIAAWLVSLVGPVFGPVFQPAWGQSSNPNPPQQTPAVPEAPKVDEYAEAQHAINGPAGNPECVWLGRNAIALLWHDDLDTAFRHLDLYDRFGCPSGHIQAAFRCLVLHSGSVDPKVQDSLKAQAQACWINPSREVGPPAAAATPATPAGSTQATH